MHVCLGGGSKILGPLVVVLELVLGDAGLDGSECLGKVGREDGTHAPLLHGGQPLCGKLANGLHGGLVAELLDVARRVPLRRAHHLRELVARDPHLLAPKQGVQDLLPPRTVRQGDVDALGQPPPHGVVELLRPVAGADDEDLPAAVAAALADAVKLDEELGLEAPARLVLIGAAGAQHRVDLVDEDDGRLSLPRTREERPHQLFRLPDPLGGEGGGAYGEEGAGGLGGDGLGEHRLAVARRTVQEQAPRRRAQTLEEVRPRRGEDHHLAQQLLRLLQPGYVRPRDPGR
mmetsp:Transcript_9902/g.19980  ORF Transcript_9902/g.19980 Transcript_9902/m.19980 type:complete len:289 (+) Transcript_9902:57-923(+)